MFSFYLLMGSSCDRIYIHVPMPQHVLNKPLQISCKLEAHSLRSVDVHNTPNTFKQTT